MAIGFCFVLFLLPLTLLNILLSTYFVVEYIYFVISIDEPYVAN